MRTDYPSSRYLVRVEALDRHSAGDYAGILALRDQLQDDPDLRTMIVRAEHRCGRISRDELLARLRELEPELLELELSMLIDAAIAGHCLDDARTLLRRTRPDAPHAGHCALAGWRLLQALTRDPGATDAARAEVFDVVLRHVADHPEDIDARAGLTRAIAVEDMGLAGVALVLDRLQAATHVPPLRAGPPRDMGRDVTDTEVLALMQFIQRQYKQDGPQGIQLAPEVLRVQRTEAEWRDLLRAAGPVFRHVLGNITDARSAVFPQLMVKVILDIWRTLRSIGVVALRWTALFLESWTPTTAVVSAVHHANLALGRTHCHPRDFLAMHVFGDPALRPRSSHHDADSTGTIQRGDEHPAVGDITA